MVGLRVTRTRCYSSRPDAIVVNESCDSPIAGKGTEQRTALAESKLADAVRRRSIPHLTN